MAQVKKFGIWLLVLLILGGGGFVTVRYYSYIFSRTVTGVIMNVESATPSASRDFVSFAIAIKTKTGEIVTGASNDREWAVAKPGLCAEARFFPYPPWQLARSGTYFGVRLLKLFECQTPAPINKSPTEKVSLPPPLQKKAIPAPATPAPTGATAPTQPKTKGETGHKGS